MCARGVGCPCAVRAVCVDPVVVGAVAVARISFCHPSLCLVEKEEEGAKTLYHTPLLPLLLLLLLLLVPRVPRVLRVRVGVNDPLNPPGALLGVNAREEGGTERL